MSVAIVAMVKPGILKYFVSDFKTHLTKPIKIIFPFKDIQF